MTKIVVFGTGGLAQTVAHYIQNDERYTLVGFTVDRDYIDENELIGVPVVPLDSLTEIFRPEDCKVIVVLALQRVSNRLLSKQKCEEIKQLGYSIFSFISKNATVSQGTKIGENVVISPGVFIEPFSTIRDGVTVRSGAYIGHHNDLSEFCFIAPNASLSGNVVIEPHAFVGNNATIRAGITVGRDAIVGAGTTILKNVDAEAVIKAPANVLIPVDRDKININ